MTFNYHQGWQRYQPGMFVVKNKSEDIGLIKVNKAQPNYHTISVNLLWRVVGGLITKEEANRLKNYHEEHRIFRIAENRLAEESIEYSNMQDFVYNLAWKSIPDISIHYGGIDDIWPEIIYVSECKDLTTGKNYGTYGTKPILVDKPAKAIYQKFNKYKKEYKYEK